MIITIYSLVFLFASIICFVVSFYAFQKKHVMGAKELSLLLFSAGIWVFFVFFESAATTIEAKVFWSKVSYIGVVSTPVLYLLFVLRFTGRNVQRNSKQYLVLFIIPLITLLLAYTNEYHNLIWTGFSPISNTTNIISYYHGFWFWVGYFVYSYLMFFIATYHLFGFIKKYKHGFKFHGWLVVLAGFFPWLASILYVTGLNPVEGLDLTPLFMLFSGVFFAWGFLRTQFMDLTPVAREALVETLPDGIVALDQHDRIQDINENAIGFLEIDKSKYLGIKIFDTVNNVSPLLEAVVSDENNVKITVKNGDSQKTYEILKQALKYSQGSRLIIIRDITEVILNQKKIISVESRYRKMYHMFRLMSDNMTDMIWAKDLNKRYIFINKIVGQKILKTSDPEEAIGKTLDYFYNKQLAENSNYTEKYNYHIHGSNTDDIILNSKKPEHFEEEVIIDGEICCLDVSKAPIIDENGVMIGIVGSARDVTVQRNYEKELIQAKYRAEESDRFKSSFLANMSHEIRTPMNSILGFISLLEEETLTKEEKQEFLNIIRSSGERLLGTINDIIDISKVESGQMKINISEFDVNNLINYLYNMFSKEAEVRNLKFEKPEPIRTVHSIMITDKEKLYSITTNLIKNALKFTQSGFVEFDLNVDEEYLHFYVKDSGVGVSKEKLDEIFDRFNQGDMKSSRKVESSGLGLSITKAYCELLGGTVWCESEVNVGSTFFVKLPVDKFNRPEDYLINLI